MSCLHGEFPIGFGLFCSWLSYIVILDLLDSGTGTYSRSRDCRLRLCLLLIPDVVDQELARLICPLHLPRFPEHFRLFVHQMEVEVLDIVFVIS